MPETKPVDLRSRPSFIVPLRQRTPPQGYECCMSCAVKGNPVPRVTWYCNNVCLNTDANYYITNVCGVCSILILKVGPKDTGEYKVVIENRLGIAESSMILSVRGIVAGFKNCIFFFFLEDELFYSVRHCLYYRVKKNCSCWTQAEPRIPYCCLNVMTT